MFPLCLIKICYWGVLQIRWSTCDFHVLNVWSMVLPTNTYYQHLCQIWSVAKLWTSNDTNEYIIIFGLPIWPPQKTGVLGPLSVTMLSLINFFSILIYIFETVTYISIISIDKPVTIISRKGLSVVIIQVQVPIT